ncbi:hypothetical protein CHU98_g12388, partial [Xylaria longipes]
PAAWACTSSTTWAAQVLGQHDGVPPARRLRRRRRGEGEAAPGEEVQIQKTVQKKIETPVAEGVTNGGEAEGESGEGEGDDVGAAQCIWLARVRPEDCENIVRYTVLQGKVVKPDTQLRGGFDRARGLMSW